MGRTTCFAALLSLLFAATNAHGVDTDGDGWDDSVDNAPTKYNPFQYDMDADGVGDVADHDADDDGVMNSSDNAPATANADQADSDGDLWGDVIDPAWDNPEVPADTYISELNGPYQYNPNQDDFLFLSAAGSNDPVGVATSGFYFLELWLDLDNDGSFDDLTQYALQSDELTMSLNASQLQSYGLGQPGVYTLNLRASSVTSAATDSAQLTVIPEPSTLVLLGMGALGLLAYGWRKRHTA